MQREIILRIPCEIGATIYKICPKCNENHAGSCKHCAWGGCFMGDCCIYPREHRAQYKEIKATFRNLELLIKHWGNWYFPTREEAKKRCDDYNSEFEERICQK